MPNFTPQPIDLSGILNSFNSIPAAQANNTLSNQMNNAWSGIPQSSGVNLSNIPLGQFHATAAGFMPTNSTSGLSTSAVPSLVAQSQQPGLLGTVGNDIGNFLGRLGAAGHGFFAFPSTHPAWSGALYGFEHPQEANQAYDQQKNAAVSQMAHPWQQTLGRFAWDTGSSPISYLPIGPLAQVTGVTPALKLGFDAAKKAPVLGKIINGVGAIKDDLFKPLNGARDYFVNGVSKLFGSNQSDRNALLTKLQGAFAGTTPEQRANFTQLLESTAPGAKFDDPVMERLRQQVEPMLNDATQKALSKGLIDNTLNPSDFNVARYLPHIRIDKTATDGEPLVQGRLLKSTIDASKARTIPGTIADINAKSGTQFENDALKVLGYHLDQLNRASNAKDLIDSAMAHGLPTDGDIGANEIFPGTHQKSVPFTHDGQTVLLPESEAKYLDGLTNPKSDSPIGKIYRNGVNAANRLMFLGAPFIHIGNNLGWQTLAHAPSIFGRMMNRDLWKQAFGKVTPGSTMDQALQNGALHLSSQIGSKGGTRQFVNDLAKTVDNPSGSNPLKAIARGYLNLTPNVERVYRTAAFQHALDQGMAPEDATQWVRSVFGGNAPGTASKAETALTSVMPFFNWTKTAIGSNVKNFMDRPLPYSAALNSMDAINQQNTGGQHIWDNKNPLSIALGSKNAQGNPEFWAPYFPALEPLKVAKSVGQQSLPPGLLNFAFGRTNPLFKLPTQLATSQENPFGLPPDMRSIFPSPDLPPNSKFNTEPLFGNTGPMVDSRLSQAMQDLSNPFSDIQRMNGESKQAQLLTNPFASLSGSISAPNPTSNAKHAKYQQGQQAGEMRNWLKKFGQQTQAK